MTRATPADKIEYIAMIRDMLLAHHAEGRNLPGVIKYLDQTLARLNRECGQ